MIPVELGEARKDRNKGKLTPNLKDPY